MDVRELTNPQLIELIEIEKAVINLFEQRFSVTSLSVIQNNGLIMDEGTHFHVHLIPRYINDSFWDNQNVKTHEIPIKQLQSYLKELSI